MDCLIKTIPSSIITADKYGNKGLGFPLTVPCGVVVVEAAQECYLALELGDDPNFGSPIIQEFLSPMGNGWFAAPCLSSASSFLCFLALEEDGVTPFELEESADFFAVPCI
jgi:hypothetical protein